MKRYAYCYLEREETTEHKGDNRVKKVEPFPDFLKRVNELASQGWRVVQWIEDNYWRAPMSVIMEREGDESSGPYR
jgi:hypothetical protein